jgi:LAS superfamily LD-carboxypeptidase LdcB
MARNLLIAVVLIVVLVAGGVWFLYSGPQAPPPRVEAPPASRSELAVPPTAPLAPPAPALAPAPPVVLARNCEDDPAYLPAARINAETVKTRLGAPMGRQETGWEIYAPLAAQEAGVACAPDTPGFAGALALWQKAHRLAATGTMEPQTLEAMRLVWHSRRPFVAATRHGQCPAAPPETALADTARDEGYSGKPIKLRPAALQAWRRMLAAARAEAPSIAADPRLLTIFSGFRGPVEETARCVEGGCSTPARATCSAHRTGLAVDMYLGEAPGFRPESSADPNRLHLSRTAAYRWLVQNGARFGFVPYAFEPWHWEWTGEALLPPVTVGP